MPYKSIAQAAFMHINHPEIAKKWDRKYPEHKPGELPQHVGDKPKKVKRREPKG